MQPFLIPEMPALIGYGFLCAFAGMFCLLLVARMEQHRFLAALLLVLACVGGTVYASQPVTKYCSTCASSVEPGSWLWFVFCLGC